ncbi:hypothetical protein D0T25_10730 [Duganella sp. BJB488]|nr:hypothetical protein D0T26_10770 [Duganella sp. BJB489]RFP23509.1 hypothetical protein D0T25_10730 [Duganella sp. BJB488]RFP38676.1 hypothetical protein D0T24_03575 [Duganella sp. BJB480]
MRAMVRVTPQAQIAQKKKDRLWRWYAHQVLDASTYWSTRFWGVRDTTSTAEQAYARHGNHQIAGTHRAHHVSRSDIGKAVNDYLTKVTSIETLLDQIGTLYLTSWQDVWVTPRIFWIWGQWSNAIGKTFRLGMAQFLNLPMADQEILAERLIAVLERSVANMRVGHSATDRQLGHALAPRVHRGQYDMLARLIAAINKENLNVPRLTFETTVVEAVWNAHFARHPRHATGKNVFVVDQVFLGPTQNGIYLSEDVPSANNLFHVITLPRRYPLKIGTNDYGYVIRGSRAILHLAAAIFILSGFIQLGMGVTNMAWPKEFEKDDTE